MVGREWILNLGFSKTGFVLDFTSDVNITRSCETCKDCDEYLLCSLKPLFQRKRGVIEKESNVNGNTKVVIGRK